MTKNLFLTARQAGFRLAGWLALIGPCTRHEDSAIFGTIFPV